jgi:hypothetical protein
MTPAEERSDITDHRDSHDRAEPADNAEPIEKREANEPMLPTDNAEPTLPIDSTEPREPMQSTESVDHRDRREAPGTGIPASWPERVAVPSAGAETSAARGVPPWGETGAGGLQRAAGTADTPDVGIGTEVAWK